MGRRNRIECFAVILLRFANHFHYLGGVKVSNSAVGIVYYSEQASSLLRYFDDFSDMARMVYF